MTTQTIDEYRRTLEDVAGAMAPGWERHREHIERVAAPVRSWLLRELAPEPGQTLLDLAAGPGETGFEAAALVGPQGRVISADISPAMLDVARRRAAELGLANVELRVIDAERIDLPDASVDGVICRFGYMIMADSGVALAETRRVLRPGGRLALAVWGAPERNPFFAAIAMALVGGGHMPPPPPDGPGVFSMASEGRTRGLLEGAGFREARLEEVPVRCAFGGVDEYLELIADTAGPIGLVLAGLGDEERRAIAAQVADAFAPFATAEGYEVPGVTLGAVAR